MAWENVKFSDYIMFPINFLTESLQIHYMDTLYHTYQHVCD